MIVLLLPDPSSFGVVEPFGAAGIVPGAVGTEPEAAARRWLSSSQDLVNSDLTLLESICGMPVFGVGVVVTRREQRVNLRVDPKRF